MKKTVLASLLALQLAPFGTVFAGDLLQAYRDASAYDAQLQVARANLRAGREKDDQGLALLLPSVVLTGDSTRARRNSDPGNITTSGQTTTWAVTLTQPLYRPQNWITYQQSDIQVAQAEIVFTQAEQDLMVRVAQAYFDVLFSQEALLAVQSQKVAIAQQLELAKKSFEVGTATITDTHEAQARYDLVVAQEIAAQSDLEVKKRTLQTLTGKEVDPLAPLRADAQLTPPDPQDIKRWLDDAEQNSLAVRIQRATTEIAEREAAKSRAAHHPTLDLVGRVAQTSDSNRVGGGISTDAQTASVGLQLNLPLFQGFGTSSRARESAALYEAALGSLDNARRTSVLQTRQAYLGVANGLSQVKAFEAALVSSQSALEATKVGYEVGVRINNDVLNAEQQVAATRRDLARARFDTLVAQVRLRASIGALSEEDLQKVNALLAH
jgi:outer membrane protein